MYLFVVFDMDKTIIPITANEFLGRNLGALDKITQWEKDYHDKKIDDRMFAERMETILFKKPLKDIDALLKKIPVLKDVKKTLLELHKRHIKTVLITVGPGFVAENLARRYGFGSAIGTEHIVENGMFSGKIGKVLTDKDKFLEFKKLVSTFKIKLSDCVAVGDGVSDIPLFEACGFSIALNAKSQVVMDKSSVAITTDSLYDIIPHVLDTKT